MSLFLKKSLPLNVTDFLGKLRGGVGKIKIVLRSKGKIRTLGCSASEEKYFVKHNDCRIFPKTINHPPLSLIDYLG